MFQNILTILLFLEKKTAYFVVGEGCKFFDVLPRDPRWTMTLLFSLKTFIETCFKYLSLKTKFIL